MKNERAGNRLRHLLHRFLDAASAGVGPPFRRWTMIGPRLVDRFVDEQRAAAAAAAGAARRRLYHRVPAAGVFGGGTQAR